MAVDFKKNKKFYDRPLNILLADDRDADVKITLRAFSKAKLKSNISVVNDGQQALDFVYGAGRYQDKGQFPRPDLILLDIKMPKMDGLEVLKKLKCSPQYSFIPVIMLTSSRNEEDAVLSYKFGAASFISKPIDYEEFVRFVDGFNFYWHIVAKLPNPDLCRR